MSNLTPQQLLGSRTNTSLFALGDLLGDPIWSTMAERQPQPGLVGTNTVYLTHTSPRVRDNNNNRPWQTPKSPHSPTFTTGNDCVSPLSAGKHRPRKLGDASNRNKGLKPLTRSQVQANYLRAVCLFCVHAHETSVLCIYPCVHIGEPPLRWSVGAIIYRCQDPYWWVWCR